MRAGGGWLQPDHFAILEDCGVQIPFGLEHDSEVAMGRDVIRLKTERFAILGDGAHRVALRL